MRGSDLYGQEALSESSCDVNCECSLWVDFTTPVRGGVEADGVKRDLEEVIVCKIGGWR